MASRKVVGGFLLSNRSFHRRVLTSQLVSKACTRLSLAPNDGSWDYRRFGGFIEFWEDVKVEANRCYRIQQLKKSPKLLMEGMDEVKEMVDKTKEMVDEIIEKVDKRKRSTEDMGKFSCQELRETHKVLTEKMDELRGLAEDLVKLSWTSREFEETINVMLEKVKEVKRVTEDLEISVANGKQTV